MALGTVAYAGARVSAHLVDVTRAEPLLAIDDRITQPVGAIGSLLLLIEVSARLTAGETPFTLLDKVGQPPSVLRPTGSEPPRGLWSRLKVPALPIVDLAVLVGAVRDPHAINALLHHTTLAAVRQRAEELGLRRTALLDFARAARGPDAAPHFAVASVGELAEIFARLQRGEIVDRPTSERVLSWIGGSAETSFIAAALGSGSTGVGDPSPNDNPSGLHIVSMVGVEAGMRSEAGLLFGPRGIVAFAVIIEFDRDSMAAQLSVVDTLRVVGLDLMEYVG